MEKIKIKKLFTGCVMNHYEVDSSGKPTENIVNNQVWPQQDVYVNNEILDTLEDIKEGFQIIEGNRTKREERKDSSAYIGKDESGKTFASSTSLSQGKDAK